MKNITEKQKKTIMKMKENRKEDYINLREIATKRLQWSNSELQKAITNIKNLELQKAKLEGAIIVLQELLK